MQINIPISSAPTARWIVDRGNGDADAAGGGVGDVGVSVGVGADGIEKSDISGYGMLIADVCETFDLLHGCSR